MKQDQQENVGTRDAYLRVSGGLLLLALAAFGRFGRIASWTMFAAGASSVASGISRYCPITEALEASALGPGKESEDARTVPRDLPWENDPSFRSKNDSGDADQDKRGGEVRSSLGEDRRAGERPRPALMRRL